MRDFYQRVPKHVRRVGDAIICIKRTAKTTHDVNMCMLSGDKSHTHSLFFSLSNALCGDDESSCGFSEDVEDDNGRR